MKVLHFQKKEKILNDAFSFVEYMCYDEAIKECVHDLKYSGGHGPRPSAWLVPYVSLVYQKSWTLMY